MWTRRKSALKRGTPPSGQPIIPFPTGRNLFLVATRHFVPGYLHLVPTGRQSVRTCPHFRSHITPRGRIRGRGRRRGRERSASRERFGASPADRGAWRCGAHPPEPECFPSNLWEPQSGECPRRQMPSPTQELNRRQNQPVIPSRRKILRT